MSQKKNYTYEEAQQAIDSLPIKTRTYMKDHLHALFLIARDNGWLDSLLPKMDTKVKVTKEYIEGIIRKHPDIDKRSKLKKYLINRAYNEARNSGLLDEIFPSQKIPYTDEFIWNVVNQFTSVRDLKIDYPNVYHNIWRTHREDVFFKNYTIAENNLKRGIYVYEFPDNHAYVGLTWNFKIRHQVHMRDNSSNVYRYIKKTGLIPLHKVLIPISLNDKEAQEQEDYWIEKYRSDGWIMLNTAKAGGLGHKHNKQYSYDECKSISLQYKTRTELRYHNRTAFNICKSNGWLEEFYPLRFGRKVQQGKVSVEEMQQHIYDRKISNLHDLHGIEFAVWRYGKEHNIKWKLYTE